MSISLYKLRSDKPHSHKLSPTFRPPSQSLRR